MEGSFNVKAWSGTPKHIKARDAHRALAIFYTGAFVVLFVLLAMAGKQSPMAALSVAIVFAIPAAAHGVIALGANKGSKWAQMLSVLAGVLMLLAIPIGTVIGIYLLRNSNWSRPKAAA